MIGIQEEDILSSESVNSTIVVLECKMASNTTLVNIDEDTALKVAVFVSKLVTSEQTEAYLSKCKELIDARKTKELIDTFMSQEEVIFNMDNDSDVECLFQALFSVIYTLNDDTSDTAEIISSIASILTKDGQPKTRLRMSVLTILFNLIFEGKSKCHVLNALLIYAIKTNQTSLVTHFDKKLEAWIDSWEGVGIDSKRTLFRTFSEVLEANEGGDSSGGFSSVVLKSSIRYLKTFAIEGATGGGVVKTTFPVEAETVITAAVINAIQSPLQSFADRVALLECVGEDACTFSSANAASLKLLVQLLKLICDGDYSAFVTFKAANNSIFSQNGLDMDEVDHAMKLLSLCSLVTTTRTTTSSSSSSTGSSSIQLSFSAIEQALQIGAEEVELWVIEAISAQLIDASIDQLTATVSVTRYAQLTFGPLHWKLLQQQLSGLRKQLNAVVETLQRSASTSDASTSGTTVVQQQTSMT